MFLQIALTIIGAFLSVALTKILIQNGRQIRMMAESMGKDHRAIIEALERISVALGITVSKKAKGSVG